MSFSHPKNVISIILNQQETTAAAAKSYFAT